LTRDQKTQIHAVRCEKALLKNIMRVEVPNIMKRNASLEELSS